jgi:integrase
MSAFERPKGSGKWVAKFQYKGVPRWVPDGPWATKRQAMEAERRHRDFLKARRSSETAASFSERWVSEWARPEASTQRLYAAAVKRFADYFGPTPLREIGRLEARAWALTVPRGVSQVVGTMFEDARNVEVVDANPFSNLRLPATERKAGITAPTLDEYRELLDACTILGGYGAEFRAMIQFAGWTGIRQGELFALQWSEVAETEITVKHSRKFDGSIGPPKNGKVRMVPLLPPARALDQVPRRRDEFVFHSARGKPLSRVTHMWAWQKVKSAARLDIRWHDLRHFCATQLLELGLSHFDVSIQLGHTDGGALVMSRYGHPSIDAAKARLLQAFELHGDEIGSETGSREAAK